MLLEALAGIFPLAETRLSRNLPSPEWERTSKLGYCLKIRDYPRERGFCLPAVYSCGRTLADVCMRRRRRRRRQFVCLVLAFKVRQLVLLPLRTAGVLSPRSCCEETGPGVYG